MEKCAICQKETDKCCSLCNKMFYCSQQHQEVHWHMNHKFNCQGKHRSIQSNQTNQEQFKIYAQSQPRSSSFQTRSFQQQAKVFIQAFESRLTARAEVMNHYNVAKQNSTPPILQKDLLKQCNQLVKLSQRVSQCYKPGLGDHLDEVYGLITNSFIIKMDEMLDRVLQARCYQLSFMNRQLREVLLLIASEIDPYPQYLGEQFKKTYQNLLWAIIDISENASLDKISEKMFANFVKLTQRFQGAWEQIYAYFNFGRWYASKTYFQKAIKSFVYSAQLAAKHNINQGAGLFIADTTYNIAICRYSLKQTQKAINDMQQAFRLRCQCVGKSSMQASEALFVLSKWLLKEKKYQSCLQFVMECLRIRKVNSSFEKQLQEVKHLIYQIYETIKQEKRQNQRVGVSGNNKYYQKLLENQLVIREQEPKKESFTKRLLQQEKQMVVFKLVVTPQLAETLSSQQWSKIGQLIDLQDTRMDKDQAIRIIFESQFSQSLSEEQRMQFVKLNKLG